MGTKSKNPEGQQAWPETQWSIVICASGDSEEKRNAIERLLATYWPVLQAHLAVRKRLDYSDAEDFLQEFFIKKIVEQNIVERADYTRGKFRSFILKSLENFLRDYYRSSAYRNRPVQIPEEMLGEDIVEPVTDVFDKAWAFRVFYQANELFQQFCKQNNRTQQWNVYRERVLRPVFYGEIPQTYEDLAKNLDGLTAKQARNLFAKAKANFSKSLRVVISDYVEDELFIDEEIDQLLSVLKNADNLDEVVAPFLQGNSFFESEQESKIRSQYASVVFEDENDDDQEPISLGQAWNRILDSNVGDAIPACKIADSKIDHQVTLRELLFDAAPNVDAIECLRLFAKKKHGSTSDITAPCYFGLYLLCIAVGVYKCNRMLSQLLPEKLDHNFRIAEAYEWLDSRSREYLAIARKLS